MFKFCLKYMLPFVILGFVLEGSVTTLAQVTPQPLSDEEFQQVLQSSDTLEWMKIVALTDKQAKKLSKCDYVWYQSDVDAPRMMTLWLKGLKVITEKQARILKRSEAMCIFLDGLDSLTDEQAEWLSSYSAKTAILRGGPPSGSDIERWRGLFSLGLISLNGLSHLTDSQAKKLGQSQASALNLNGLKSLTELQAKSLAKFEGTIDLDLLDMSAIGLFLKYKGRLRPPDLAPRRGPKLYVKPDSLRKK